MSINEEQKAEIERLSSEIDERRNRLEKILFLDAFSKFSEIAVRVLDDEGHIVKKYSFTGTGKNLIEDTIREIFEERHR